MQKWILFVVLATLIVGCYEKPCPCKCGKCGTECRNRCEKDRCIIGEACCEECDCPSKKPIKG